MDSLIDTYWYKVPFANRQDKIDEWVITLLQKLIYQVRAEFDEYNIPKTVELINTFLDDLSKWYIRRSRDRFASGNKEAFETLYYVLVEVLKLTAPLTPFISEHLYQEMVVKGLSAEAKPFESIHLVDFPEADVEYWEKNAKLLEQMQGVQEIVALGQSLRTQNALKVRQPLAEIYVSLNQAAETDEELEPWMKDLIAAELNVVEVSEHTEFPTLEGWLSAQSADGKVKIALNTNLTAELQREGALREFIRQIQAARKKSGFNIGEKIRLEYATEDAELVAAIQAKQTELSEQVSAVEVSQIATEKMSARAEKIDSKVNSSQVMLVISKVEAA